MPRFLLHWVVALSSFVLTACGHSASTPAAAEQPADTLLVLHVAAAADLHYALDSLIQAYRHQFHDLQVTASYGSSGKFYEQLRQGAPFDVFFSADSRYPQQLHAQGLTASAPQPYAIGQLVLWSRTLDPNLKGINTLLDARVRKIALANPVHAPYGQKAVEILRHYQLYEQLQPKLVLGENIAQAANYAATGAADAGLLALSLARSPELRRQGRYYLIPQEAYTPLNQSFVVLKKAPRQATQFTDFVRSKQGVAILQAFGFNLPR